DPAGDDARGRVQVLGTPVLRTEVLAIPEVLADRHLVPVEGLEDVPVVVAVIDDVCDPGGSAPATAGEEDGLSVVVIAIHVELPGHPAGHLHHRAVAERPHWRVLPRSASAGSASLGIGSSE